MLSLASAVVLSLGVAAVAHAVSFKSQAGNLIATFGGSISPKALPKDKYVPVTTNFFGKIETSDGTHPSAFREAVVDIDKDVKVNVKGFPVCKPSQLEARDTNAAMKVCGSTVLGKGLAHVEIAFPEQKPILVKSPLTVFNGGEKGGKVKLLIHIFVTVPAPTAVVTEVTIARKGTRAPLDRKDPGDRRWQRLRNRLRFRPGQDLHLQRQEDRLLRSQMPRRPLQGERSVACSSRTKRTPRTSRRAPCSKARSPCPARRRASRREFYWQQNRKGRPQGRPFSCSVGNGSICPVRRCAGRSSPARCRRSAAKGACWAATRGRDRGRACPVRRRRSA